MNTACLSVIAKSCCIAAPLFSIGTLRTSAPRASTWVSLTGGEPLLQPSAVAALVDELSVRKRRIYLETHGLHAEALEIMDGAIADARGGVGRRDALARPG